MEFLEFKSEFQKQNILLKIALLLVVITSSVVIILQATQKKYFAYQGRELFEERLLAVEVCRLGFLSISKEEPNEHFVSGAIIKLLLKDPLELNVERFLQIKSIDMNKCKVIYQSNKKIYSFEIDLDGNNLNPFYYRIIGLTELGIGAKS